MIVPLFAPAATTWLFVKIIPLLSRKNPDPVPDPADALTSIETTAGITRAARAAIESGARCTVFLVSTKLVPRFVEELRPIVAPIPPATSAITIAITKRAGVLRLSTT